MVSLGIIETYHSIYSSFPLATYPYRGTEEDSILGMNWWKYTSQHIQFCPEFILSLFIYWNARCRFCTWDGFLFFSDMVDVSSCLPSNWFLFSSSYDVDTFLFVL